MHLSSHCGPTPLTVLCRGLVSSQPSLLDLVHGVCGAAVVYGGKISTVGKVREEAGV